MKVVSRPVESMRDSLRVVKGANFFIHPHVGASVATNMARDVFLRWHVHEYSKRQ